MKKTLPILVALLLSCGAAANAAATPMPVSLTQVTPTTYSASVGDDERTNTFSLDFSAIPAGLTSLTAFVTANFAGGTGYDVTGVSFDGVSFTAVVNFIAGNYGVDVWSYQLDNVIHGPHSLVITGIKMGAPETGFSASLGLSNTPTLLPTIIVSSIAEPETSTMVLAGLGVMGIVSRRRRKT